MNKRDVRKQMELLTLAREVLDMRRSALTRAQQRVDEAKAEVQDINEALRWAMMTRGAQRAELAERKRCAAARAASNRAAYHASFMGEDGDSDL